MFKICKYQLQQTFTSPRIYIALFLGCAIHIISAMPLLEFAEYIQKPLCIWEGFIYFNCDTYIVSTAFLGIIVLVSDIPFSTQNETYTLLRVSRIKWVAGKILYLLAVCLFYYIVILLVGIAFIAPNAYVANFWSEPLLFLVKNSNQEILLDFNVYFPYQHILQLSPLQAVGASFFLCVVYGFIMSLLIFWLNTMFSRIISYVSAMMVHVISYLLATLPISNHTIRFSLLGNSLLMYHNINNYYQHLPYFTLNQSYLIFFLCFFILQLLINKSIRKYDFRITVGTKQ